MKLAISFMNFGPYHLARLRSLGQRLSNLGGTLIAHEMGAKERKYPWTVERGAEPFTWRTLFPDQIIEDVPASACSAAMCQALDEDRPDAVAIVGYFRPESLAALAWAERHDRPAILLSESQKMDAPRVWWKEAIKGRRVRRFSAALVGGPRHRDYLESLGMPRTRIVLGYNAIDHEGHRERVLKIRKSQERQDECRSRPFFLSVSRFAPEKNLIQLLHAFALYRSDADPDQAWDLMLCGGGELEGQIDSLSVHLGIKSAVHRPGFLSEEQLAPFYESASGFILPSRVEPWGLVANEAAASGLPLLISDRCGCVETLVPDTSETTGRRFDPDDVESLAASMAWLASLDVTERRMIGQRAERVASEWGAARFAQGMLDAVERASGGPVRRANRETVEGYR